MNAATTPFPTSPATPQPSLAKIETVATAPGTSKTVALAPAAKKTSAAKPAVKKQIGIKVRAKELVKSGAKPAAKSLVKLPAKPAVKAPAKTAATQPVPKQAATKPVLANTSASASTKRETLAKAEKLEKNKKPKLVRDSFTIPKAEYLVLDDLKQRANKLTRPAKKSELLRAGIKALAALSDAAFLTALAQVPAIKTGRPSTER